MKIRDIIKQQWTSYFIQLLFLLSTLLFNCSEDNSINSKTGTMTGNDGKTYQTIKIGSQLWLSENLKETQYRNGAPIPHVTNNSEWKDLSSDAYCMYENNQNYGEVYGYLYNWFVISNNIAPSGWHVPTDEDWKILEEYLGISISDTDKFGPRGTTQGNQLKEQGTSHWISPNNSNNESGFTALPSGFRYYDNGDFVGLSTMTRFWTSTEYDGNDPDTRSIYRHLETDSTIYRYTGSKKYGLSIRLVKDSQ